MLVKTDVTWEAQAPKANASSWTQFRALLPWDVELTATEKATPREPCERPSALPPGTLLPGS